MNQCLWCLKVSNELDNASKEALLKKRIRARVDILEGWIKNGAPDNYVIPSSLNQVRVWEDINFGIEKIGSPASFTTKHKTHGREIRKIQKLLEVLHKPVKKKTPATKRAYDLKMENSALRGSMIAEANKYTVMEELYSNKCNDFTLTKYKLNHTQEELGEANDEIERLRAQLGKKERTKKHLTLIDGNNNGE